MQPPSTSKLGIALIITATSMVVIVASAYTFNESFMEKSPQGIQEPLAETWESPVVYQNLPPSKTTITSKDSRDPGWPLDSYRTKERSPHPPAATNQAKQENKEKEKNGPVVRQAGNSSYAPGQVKKTKNQTKVSVNLPRKKPGNPLAR